MGNGLVESKAHVNSLTGEEFDMFEGLKEEQYVWSRMRSQKGYEMK